MKRYLIISLLALLAIYPDLAHAQLFSSGTTFLQALVDLLTNVWSRLFAIISVIILGVMAMYGRLGWFMVVSVTIGLILAFGSAAIVDSVNSSI